MPATNVCPSEGLTLKLEDIFFTKVDANRVHHPHEDALVVTAKIANNIVHRILVDNGSTINVLYWHTYQKIGLTRTNLSPTTSPLYGFTRDYVVPKKDYQAGSHPKRIFLVGNNRD